MVPAIPLLGCGTICFHFSVDNIQASCRWCQAATRLGQGLNSSQDHKSCNADIYTEVRGGMKIAELENEGLNYDNRGEIEINQIKQSICPLFWPVEWKVLSTSSIFCAPILFKPAKQNVTLMCRPFIEARVVGSAMR